MSVTSSEQFRGSTIGSPSECQSYGAISVAFSELSMAPSFADLFTEDIEEEEGYEGDEESESDNFSDTSSMIISNEESFFKALKSFKFGSNETLIDFPIEKTQNG